MMKKNKLSLNLVQEWTDFSRRQNSSKTGCFLLSSLLVFAILMRSWKREQ